MLPCESAAKEISFEWLHRRQKLDSIIHFGIGRVNTVTQSDTLNRQGCFIASTTEFFTYLFPCLLHHLGKMRI